MTQRAPGSRPRLSEEDQQSLLRLARETLMAHLAGRPRPAVDSRSPALRQRLATFVTLRMGDTGELRGCRGETVARQPLCDSVAEMVVASAVGDPRFEPVREHEVAGLRIEISVLSPMSPIRPQDVEIGRHGLMIIEGGRIGLLLPSVPVSCGWDRDRFLAGLCLKAGLPEDAWTRPASELLAFETLSWGESDSVS